jgi:hypothetical protein
MMPPFLLLSRRRRKRASLEVVEERASFVSPLPVSAKRLAKCTVQLSDAKLANCTLLPLFDRRGVTAKVLLLSADTGECRVVNWRSGLVYVPLLWAARMDMPWAAAQEVSAAQALWFHDSRGLVERCRSSLRGLNASNCAGLLPKEVVSVLWWRDLSRVSGVWLKKTGGIQFGRWKADWLAAAPPQPRAEAPAKPVRGWVLDPIWMR